MLSSNKKVVIRNNHNYSSRYLYFFKQPYNYARAIQSIFENSKIPLKNSIS